jgi:WD40-like Beta Propeller Repeat
LPGSAGSTLDWPVRTPEHEVFERVVAGARRRTRHRRQRTAAIATALAVAVAGAVLAASLPGTGHTRVHTTPADRADDRRPDASPQAQSTKPGTAGAAATPSHRSGTRSGPVVTLPDVSLPTSTTTTSPPRPAPIGGQLAMMSSNELHVVDLATGHSRKVTDPFDVLPTAPRWSPDGSRFVFTATDRSDNSTQVFVMDADGSHVRQLTHLVDHPYAPAWSPDGRQIVFTLSEKPHDTLDTSPYRPIELWVMDADGTHQHRVVVDASQASWSPDGHRLAFSCGSKPGICLANADGTGRTTIPNTADKGNPVWSPDGNDLLVSRDDPNAEVGMYISVIRPDGTFERDLLHTSLVIGFDWSPDGRWVAAALSPVYLGPGTCMPSPCEDNQGIWLVKADASRVFQVTNQNESDPSFPR